MTERATVAEGAARAAKDGHSLCWFCREDRGQEPQCPHCVKVQPLGPNSDYFSAMGLPRKLGIDARVLEPVFHALSRRFHPDMYRLASPRERVIALENSALLNQAYRTLRDPFDRARYLLQLEQGRAHEAKDAPPQELFEEILETQELLAEYRMAEGEERGALQSQLRARRDELQAEQDRRAARLTGELFPRWDALQEGRKPVSREAAAPVLQEIGCLLGERSYLRRVLDTLSDQLDRED
jgi:molecular chaperone HscB